MGKAEIRAKISALRRERVALKQLKERYQNMMRDLRSASDEVTRSMMKLDNATTLLAKHYDSEVSKQKIGEIGVERDKIGEINGEINQLWSSAERKKREIEDRIKEIDEEIAELREILASMEENDES